MSGNLDLNANVPWLRARTGDGHLLLRGRPQDVDASTIAGTLDIATATVHARAVFVGDRRHSLRRRAAVAARF